MTPVFRWVPLTVTLPLVSGLAGGRTDLWEIPTRTGRRTRPSSYSAYGSQVGKRGEAVSRVTRTVTRILLWKVWSGEGPPTGYGRREDLSRGPVAVRVGWMEAVGEGPTSSFFGPIVADVRARQCTPSVLVTGQ